MAVMKRRHIVGFAGVFLAEAVDVMNAVIHRDADGDGGDGDGHHVQGNIQDAHQSQDNAGGQDIRQDADDGQGEGPEQDQQHQGNAQHHDPKGFDLGSEQALQHVVVQHHHAADLELVAGQAEFIAQVRVDFFQELLAAQVGRGIQDAHVDAGFVVVNGDIRIDQLLLYLLRQFLVDDGQFKGIELLALVQVFSYAQERGQRLHLAHCRQAVQVVVHRFDAVDLVGGEPGVRRVRGFRIETAKQVVQVGKFIVFSRRFLLFLPVFLDGVELQDHVQRRGAA